MVTNLQYDRLVERGIEILSNIKTAKYDLCELALKVCDIKIGGHGRDKSIYSIKKYADDIGMSADTLRKWLEEHRNVAKKLPVKPKASDYRVIRQVMKEVDNKSTPSQVRVIYDKYKDYTLDDMKLLQVIKTAKTLRNFLQDNKLSLFKKEDVIALKAVLKEINEAK
tara:strand:+ start:530 stop:1030 length:501 start_codon:yes stop_codon:yes gene_type:complete